MEGTCTVSSWVTMRDGCPIMFSVGGSGLAFCTIGDENFEFQIEPEALRDMVRLGAEALDEMDALYANENPSGE